MFERLVLHGARASLVWGYRTVATVTEWRIAKHDGTWRLAAKLTQADRFQCQQAVKLKELHFTAPRDNGRWCWELVDVMVGTTELRAQLGQPLQ